MKRRLFTLAAALSLLLFTATLALWVRSYWVRDDLVLQRSGDRYTVLNVWCGSVHLGEIIPVNSENPPSDRWVRHTGLGSFHYVPFAPSFWNRLGFYRDASLHVYGHHGVARATISEPRIIGVGHGPRAPIWSIVAASTLVPVVWAHRRHVIRRRVRSGRCPACGYDLRATPDRCPECGTPVDPVCRRGCSSRSPSDHSY